MHVHVHVGENIGLNYHFSRLDLTEDLRPPTPAHVTTLRIKSVTGHKVGIQMTSLINGI